MTTALSTQQKQHATSTKEVTFPQCSYHTSSLQSSSHKNVPWTGVCRLQGYGKPGGRYDHANDSASESESGDENAATYRAMVK